MNIYKLDNINKSYSNNIVFDKTNLTIEEGKIYALVGENGSGKTTLLDILAMLSFPFDGKLYFYDNEVNNNQNCFKLRQKISYLMQNPILFKTTIFNNIAYGLKIRKANNIEDKINNYAKALNIQSLLNKKPSQISGGEAQKTAIARTFIINTPVILLDEPTANLDDDSVDYLEKLFYQAKQSLKTIVFTTHLVDMAYKFADEVIVIKDNRAHEDSHQNFYSGEIMIENGSKMIKINNDIFFFISTNKKGHAKVSIDPKEILVSNERFHSSARNCIQGKVTGILLDETDLVKITIDCGVKIISQITRKSMDELKINVGNEVFFTFKTSSIKVY